MKRPWLEANGNCFPYRKLIHVASLKARIGWQSLRTDEFVGEGPYCVTGTDFQNGKINWSTAYHVSTDRYEMDQNIQLAEGDLLVTKDGTIGKVAVVRGLDAPATLNSGVFVVRPKTNDLATDFLGWVVRSKVFDDFVAFNFSGSTINHLYQNVFETFRFPFPDLPTQKRIASFLDRETARIDELITKKERLVALLGEKFQALRHTAITQGAPEEHETVGGPNQWFDRIPKSWTVKPLRHVVLLQRGHDLPSDARTEGKYPIYSSGGISGTHSMCSSNAPGIVTGRYGTIGKFHFVEEDYWALNTSLYSRTIFEHPKYVFYLLEDLAHIFILNSSKSAVPGVDRNDIHSELVPVPPHPEQVAIAGHLDALKSELGTIEVKTNASIDRLKEYRSALITAAVTGQINVDTYGKTGATSATLDRIEEEMRA